MAAHAAGTAVTNIGVAMILMGIAVWLRVGAGESYDDYGKDGRFPRLRQLIPAWSRALNGSASSGCRYSRASRFRRSRSSTCLAKQLVAPPASAARTSCGLICLPMGA